MPEELRIIACDELTPDCTQPRKSFLKEELERLAASIAARGVLQPLRVMRDDARGCYVIICGESRWRAAKLAGLTHVPCVVCDGQIGEEALLADRIVENRCRSDLNEIEFAAALQRLRTLMRCTGQELAAELGISPAAVTRSEALLSLPEDLQQLVARGTFSASAAYEVSRLPDAESQRALAREVVAGRLSRDGVAERVRGQVGRRTAKPKPSRLSCRLEGGVAVTFSSDQPLVWDDLLAALARLQREAKKLCERGQDVAALGQAPRAV